MSPLLLFIDDCDQDAHLASILLARDNIDVEYVVAADEHELRHALAKGMPAMILCDISLPQWDCWSAHDLCQMFAPSVPFAIYSGTVSMRDRELANGRGVFSSIEKDLPAELVAAVRRALELQ